MVEDIRRLASRVVYENRWMRVREDDIERRDGTRSIYGVVEKADFVVIAAIDRGEGVVHLVEQYRYPVGGRHWELPQGAWETRPGTAPEEVAKAELREETGLRAGKITRVGELFQAYGYATQRYQVFLAEHLAKGATELELEEQDLISQPYAIEEFETMLRAGVIRDSTTVAAWGLIRLKGLV